MRKHKSRLLFTGMAAILTSAVPVSANAGNKLDAAKRYVSRVESPRTEAGSALVRQQRVDGSIHETAYNSQVNVRFSQDIAADGTISGAHWVDQTTGRKVTIDN